MAKIFEIVRGKIAPFLYGIFIWAMNTSIRKRKLQISRPEHCDEHVGVAYALCSPHAHVKARKILHSCMIQRSKSSQLLPSPSPWPNSWSSSPSSYPWDKSTSGDILGTESGVHMCSSQDIPPWENTKPYIRKQSLQGRVYIAKKRDIPPPISILRKDGPNYKGLLPSSLQFDGEDGRLLLGENEEERCEYLQTIRENGRLIMNLVTVDYSSRSSNAPDEEIDGSRGT